MTNGMEKLIQTISHTCACFHYIIFFDINTTVLYKDQKEGLHVKAKNYHVYNNLHQDSMDNYFA